MIFLKRPDYTPGMDRLRDWPEIEKWRRETRQALIAERRAISMEQRRSAQEAIAKRLRTEFPELEDAAIGFYWPIQGELDLRPVVSELIEHGAEAALPVVVHKDRPVEFWDWHPGTPMVRGASNIPVPKERKPVQPSALLVPLLGFDGEGHRLGYGGGYYDRTLASYRLKPLLIGVGFEMGRLPTIHPQPHDMPMDAIVTETSCERFAGDKASAVASAPCYLHETKAENDR